MIALAGRWVEARSESSQPVTRPGPIEAKARIEGRRVGLEARAAAYGGPATATRPCDAADMKKAAKVPSHSTSEGRAQHRICGVCRAT